MSTKSIDAIAAGFPHDKDRYSLALCEKDRNATELAWRLERFSHHQPPDWVKQVMKVRVAEMYAQMVKLRLQLIACDGEPYMTSEDMQDDVLTNKRMFLRKRRLGPVVGHLTQEWRAVHDYFGHVLGKAPFTLSGELRAYSIHVNEFPRVCWPFIWNNVVLENAFRLNRGHFLCLNEQCSSKIVFDREHFGTKEDWYRL